MPGRENCYYGVLLYDKPSGVSSHEAVMDVRRTLNQRRVGHTGTLDPQAEGLLVLCLGKATKIARFISEFDKTYEAEIFLGCRSTTYDSEGVEPDSVTAPVPDLSEYEIRELLSGYCGKIKQKVPIYSAVHVGGRRLYELARSGAPVEPPEREIEIKQIQFIGYDKPRLRLRVTCSRGTYIRSLAHDIGEKIGCGAYLSWLRRTAVGGLNLNDALQLSQVKQYHEAGTLDKYLLTYHEVLPYPTVTVKEESTGRVTTGQVLTAKDIAALHGDFSAGDRLLLQDAEGEVLAVVKAEIPSAAFGQARNERLFSYERVLN
jgi:tRNA pseudouridine55 synthase